VSTEGWVVLRACALRNFRTTAGLEGILLAFESEFRLARESALSVLRLAFSAYGDAKARHGASYGRSPLD
jgi:hypothetical protein